MPRRRKFLVHFLFLERAGCHVDPTDIIAPLAFLATVGIIAGTVVKVVRLRANRTNALPDDVTERLEALEQSTQSLQHDLAETQERLDFAERLLAKARDERRIGS